MTHFAILFHLYDAQLYPQLFAYTTVKKYINIYIFFLSSSPSAPIRLPSADIYIMKYNQLPHWIDILTQGWVKGIAFDEIQELRRGADALKGYAAKQICQAVTYKVGLTASLIYNYGIESFNIASILRPESDLRTRFT